MYEMEMHKMLATFECLTFQHYNLIKLYLLNPLLKQNMSDVITSEYCSEVAIMAYTMYK